MKSWCKVLAIALCAVVCHTTLCKAQSSKNLMMDMELSTTTGDSSSGWELIQATPRVAGGLDGEADQQYLYLRKDAPGDKDHFWWSRKMPVTGGESLKVEFQAKASGEGDYYAYSGVELYDSAGKWLGFIQGKTVARADKKYPQSVVPAVTEWKSFSDDVTLPPGARSIAIRLALSAESKAEANFRRVSVKPTSIPVTEAMAGQPDRLDRFDIPLTPVSANGVALTPDWKLEGAELHRSSARTKVCLNGLWAVQPGTDNGRAPKENDWAFFKVPGLFRENIYSVYGQDKTSWAKQSVYNGRPIWYVRDVEVPATPAQSSIYLDVSRMHGMAIKVYWNGVPAGIFTDQLGGRIDLTALAKPGEKGQLAILALFVMPETKSAHHPDLIRSYRPGARKVGGLLDMYLSIEPKQSYLSQIRLSPSVRNKSLRIQTNAAPTQAQLTYKVRLTDPDGSVALQQDLGAGRTEGRFQIFDLAWEKPRLWNPDDPYLYTAVVQAFAGGRLVDESLPIKFGFRETWIDGKKIMFNGAPLRLRPRCWTPDTGDGKTLRRAISVLKDTGFNCLLRPGSGGTDDMETYNTWSFEEYYSITDEMGMLVIPYTAYRRVAGWQFGGTMISEDEIDPLVAWTEDHQIDDLYNHPSVIAYSGFGDQPMKGVNYLYLNPEVWGIMPMDTQQFMKRLPNDAVLRDRIAANARRARRFIEGIKKADPTRPYLSHSDTGVGDGWGIFDYFSWTPLQECEDWPRIWARQGNIPIGSTEHGMPHPGDWMNHAMHNGGDLEPWMTEYGAGFLGDKAYAMETPAYIEFIKSDYNPDAGNYKLAPRHGLSGSLLVDGQEIFHGVSTRHNKAIYRAWRTFGAAMGIEPFGASSYFLDEIALAKGNGSVVADPSANLKTTGTKLDRWAYKGGWPSWPNEGALSYPEKPTGHAPPFLNPVGQVLHEVNSPLLVYIAGAGEHFTVKDHVYWSGDRVQKQVAVVWDGFAPRSLSARYTVRLGDKQIGEGTVPLSLAPGQILLAPFEFKAPDVQDRADGVIELTVRDTATGNSVATDRFEFQVYQPYSATEKNQKTRIALFDPAGESAGMFQRMGLNVAAVNDIGRIPPCDVLVIGRRGLGKLPDGQWLGKLPAALPVLILEQTDTDLQAIGLRCYPIRTRQVFALPQPSPMLKGIQAEDLVNWRISPTLLPTGTEPLRDNYNYHENYHGTVASVTIETPTVGNFTPHLQNGFDLRETALLETAYADHRILFCQLSLPDGAGVDPVATRLASNILEKLSGSKARSARSVVVVGADDRSTLAADVGAVQAKVVTPGKLSSNEVALVETLPADPQVLTQWVRNGGRAAVLPQDISTYATYFPNLKVAGRPLTLVPMGDWAYTPLFRGVGRNNLHMRQPLPQLMFNDQTNILELPDGKGQWVLLGFDPRKMDLTAQPYLRLTQRNQYRLLSQILTNLDADLSAPLTSRIQTIGASSRRFDIGGLVRVSPAADRDSNWAQLSFDDSKWSVFDLSTKETGHGHALIRMRFSPQITVAGPLSLQMGAVDDYDETYLNGVKIGETTPANTDPEKAHFVSRVYAIPDGLLRVGQENVLAVYLWNRNAETQGWKAWLRGPISVGPPEKDTATSLYFGSYKPSDDPYLQMHW